MVVIFPDQFDLGLRKDQKYPTVIGGFSREEVGEAISRLIRERFAERKRRSDYPSPQGKCHLKIIQIILPERTLHLALESTDSEDNFLFFDPPIQSRSQRQGSHALYCLAHKKRALLLQYLSPHSQTSSHNHENVGWTENYYLLAGRAELRTDEGQHQLTTATQIVPIIRPEVTHQVITEDQPSLILIEIKGDPDWFDKWLTGKGHCFKDLS